MTYSIEINLNLPTCYMQTQKHNARWEFWTTTENEHEILRKHWLTKVWILFVLVFVVLQVSDPYMSTYLTNLGWYSYLFGAPDLLHRGGIE